MKCHTKDTESPRNTYRMSPEVKAALIADLQSSPNLCIDKSLALEYDYSEKSIEKIRRDHTHIRFTSGKNDHLPLALKETLITLVDPSKKLNLSELARVHNCRESTLSGIRRKYYGRQRQATLLAADRFPYLSILRRALEPYRIAATNLGMPLDDVLQAFAEYKRIQKIFGATAMEDGDNISAGRVPILNTWKEEAISCSG